MIYLNDSSRVWHVAKAGNDANSGHAGQYPVNLANDAKLTIGAAIAATASGDTIIIWPGDYDESVSTGAKALTIIGVSRSKTRIVPSGSGQHGITFDNDFTLKNLTVEAIVGSANAINGLNKQNLRVEDCDLYGAVDGIYYSGGQGIRVINSRIRGKWDACNFNNVTRLYVENTTFEALGTYGTAQDCRGVNATGNGIYRNCIFIASRDDASTKQSSAIEMLNTARSVFDNCIFIASSGASNTGPVTGIRINSANAIAVTRNCLFYTSSTGTSTVHDINNISGSVVVMSNYYSPTKTNGTIIQSDSNWANALAAALFTNGAANKLAIDAAGRVEAGNVEDINAELLQKAAKMLLNKAVQDKLSGAIQYYDDNGQTVILTHTPSEDESSFTRTVS